ncbi:MAG: aminotransferase class IV [Candidatus Magasanikiibacteriota bacterium]
MLGKYCIHNGKVVLADKAKISIDNIEFTYGFAVYENLKVRNSKVYFLVEHVERLFYSAEKIGLKHNFSRENIEEWILLLTKKNKIESANIKVLLIGGKEPDLYIQNLAPKFLERKYYKQGVKVVTYNYERFLPQAKTLNMLPSYLIYRKAVETGAHDTLLIDKKGYITEGTRSNFFTIKGKVLYSAPVEKVLDGVTRRTVIDCALKNGYKLIEQDISLDKVFKYDGAFLTHTSGKIVPIKVIDDKCFPEICVSLKNLINLYNNYLDELYGKNI